ncbi:MAG TPA: AAA family ATPase, partial [Bacteroidia bacterium]|nr:AAA family ATPase [Bacteroidia bacterium]
VPNFVGGSLPRRDRGDRDYYCTTMLTLFKPWRTGKDLKNLNQSWDDAFMSHNFSSKQQKIMDNFNVRYECLDARDDFSAQLKKGDNHGFFPKFMTSDILTDLDDDQLQEGAEFEQNIESYEVEHEADSDKYTELGNHGLKVKTQMDATMNIIKDVGWLDKCPDSDIIVNKSAVKPKINQPGSKWKTTVQEMRQKVLSSKHESFAQLKNSCKNKMCVDPNEDNVMIVDQSYFVKSFKSKDVHRQNILDALVTQFSLNTEQERAFRIIANHSFEELEQLKMYIAGMAGTGKSQVIKTLVEFFVQVNESHRFVILGPTGTSAAQQNGSTYHYFLGINPHSGTRNEAASIAQLKARLEGVDYIFIDEVSMLSCHDLYTISSRLSKAMNEFEKPFGGINMIFAGDFAQLPPVAAQPLYSKAVGTQVDSALSSYSQESSVGKVLWHQISFVVILRDNMRQKTQTPEDEKLRTALVNMRYGKCTQNDIVFLRSRIAGKQVGKPNIASKDFRNVPVICGIHAQKDLINTLGCDRFASDTSQKLTHFYSIDKWASTGNSSKKKNHSKILHVSSTISPHVQNIIWDLYHAATDNFAGKLSLCIGMPVMIRNNDATELCITKGQEGFVVGW